MSDASQPLLSEIERNAKALRRYYQLAAFLLVLLLASHVCYSAYFLSTEQTIDYPRVALFAAVSVSVLFVEILLARVAFMLAARLGQLFDTLYAIDLSKTNVDTERLLAITRVLVALRRSETGLKVVEVEGLVEKSISSIGK